MPQRPDRFTLNASHPLANGLAFAGLGSHAGSSHFHDSSLHAKHGTCTGNFSWEQVNGCNVVESGTTGIITFPPPLKSGTNTKATVSFWFYYPTLNTYDAAMWHGAISYFHVTDTPATTVYSRLNTSDGWRTAISHGTITAAWFHYAMVIDIDVPVYTVYFNAVSVGGNASPTGTLNWNSTDFVVFDRAAGSRHVTPSGKMRDLMFWEGRALSLAEISILADPSNVMLGGLILPPTRKWWPVVAAAPGGNAPTGHLYGELVGPMGGPI